MRRPPALVRALTHLPFITALACSTGLPSGPFSSFCPSDTSAGSGNIDKPASVAVAVHGHGDGSRSAYAITVNPDLKQARAVDLTHGLMVAAPAVYFPMAVKLGSFSQDVVVSKDGNVAVILDAQDQSLRFVDVGDAKEGNAWKRHGADVAGLDARPTALAAFGNQDNLSIVVSHAGDPVGSLTTMLWKNGDVTDRKRIDVGGVPNSVALSEDGTLAVVGDAEGSFVTVLDLTADNSALSQPLPACSAGARPCRLDLGGPTHTVVVGTVPGRPGDEAPRYPVVLALRWDIPAVVVARLAHTPAAELGGEPWVQRMVSSTDRVEATVMLPHPGAAAALAPNPTPRCCQGVPFQAAPETLANGGFAYGVVAMVNGSILYLDLDAQDPHGRHTPRLIDKDPHPPGPLFDSSCNPVDLNTSADNYRVPGQDVDGGVVDLTTRPVVTVEPGTDVVGEPPVITQALDDDYVLVWQGVLPSVIYRQFTALDGNLLNSTVQDTRAAVNLGTLGVKVGDRVEIRPDSQCPCPASQPDCTVAATVTVTEVNGSLLKLDDTFAIRACLTGNHELSYRVRASHQFTVTGGVSGKDFGRVGFLEWLEVPGLRLHVAPAGYVGGASSDVTGRPSDVLNNPVTVVPDNPPPTDAVLVVPLRAYFDPFILDTYDVDPTLGRYVPAGSVPTGLVTAVIPVVAGSGSSTSLVEKAVGVMSTAGGGLVFQFDLALHPACSAPVATCTSSAQCSGVVSRSTKDSQFNFFE